MTDPQDCDHENRTYKGTDTEAAPEVIYQEWWCDDCGALVSEVFENAGYQLVQANDDIWEEETTEDNGPDVIIDGRFTGEGVSVSAYGDSGATVLDEAWFTWAEVEDRKGEGSDFTFELGVD